MSFRKLAPGISVVAAAVLGLGALAAPGASAASQGPSAPGHVSEVLGHWTAKYSKTFTFKSRDLGVCAKFTASGKITYTTTYTTAVKAAFVHWIDQVVKDPTLKVVLFNYSCTKRQGVHGVSIGQHWTGYSCSFNPSISVDASVDGLSLSVSAWPSCGDRQQAIYKTHYGGGSQHIQFNSGSPIGFGEYTDQVTGVGLLFPPPCYGVYPSAVIYDHGNSDSYGAGNIHASGKVCLNKYE